MTGIATLRINNMPSHTLKEKYVVVRVVDGEAWYYGNYPLDRALEVARELGENALVTEVSDIAQVLDEIEAERTKASECEAYGNAMGLATASEIIRRHFQ